MPDASVSFGRISLVPLEAWKFFPMDEQIVGRRDSRVGGIEISLKFLDHSPAARAHAESLRLACQILPAEGISKPFHVERSSTGLRLHGAASFTAGNDFLRLWYVHEGNCLVPAIYACKLDQRRSPDAIREIVECQHMTSTIVIQVSAADARCDAAPSAAP